MVMRVNLVVQQTKQVGILLLLKVGMDNLVELVEVVPEVE